MSKFSGHPKRSEMNETLQDVLKFPVWAIDGSNGTVDRGISKETCEHFGIRTFYSEVNQRVEAHYFPVTKKGKLSGFIKVSPNLSKKNGRFQTVGDVTVDCDLLGTEQADSKQSPYLWVVEGVWDMCSAYQSIYNNQKVGQPKRSPAVVSLLLGAGNARDNVGANIELLRKFKEVRVCFDNDSHADTNMGQDAVEQVALVFPELRNILLPCNDINELMAGEGELAVYKELLFQAKPFEVESVVQGGIGLEELLTPLDEGVHVNVLPKTMDLLHGFREREMTIVLAPTGVGKTTVCKEIGYALVKQGHSVGHVFLEEDLKKTQQSYIALDNDTHLPKFRANPNCIHPDQVKRTYENLIDTPRTMWMKHFGSLACKTLLDKFHWMYIKGMKFIILDHISMVISGQESSNERKDIDMLLTELAAFTTATGVHPIIVSHIKRVNKQAPRDKEGKVKYPYWDEVDATQARGSGAFEQLAWNIICVEPEIKEDRTRGNIRTRVVKNREWGVLGVGDVLTQNPLTGRLQTVVPEEY